MENQLHDITQSPKWDESCFNTSFENLPVGVVACDKDGRIIRMNHRNKEIFGIWGEHDGVGFCLFDDPNINEPIRDKLQTQDEFTYDYLLQPWNLTGFGKCKLSEEKQLFCRFRKMYNADGEHCGYLLVNVDATHLHHKFNTQIEQLNHRIKQICYSSNMMTWSWDLKRGVIISDRSFAPKGFEHVFKGLATFSREEFMQLIHPEDRHFFVEGVEKALKGEITSAELEIRFKFKQTAMPYIWTYFSGIVSEYDEEGRPSMMVGSTRIIQERRQMEEELRAAKEKAERSDRLKTAFIEQTNHEIRTPLNIITGYSDILSSSHSSLSDIEIKELVNGIRKNADIMVEIINNMIYLSQLQSGSLQRNDTDISLADLLEHIYNKYVGYSSEDVKLLLEIDSVRDVTIHSDSVLINSILGNLLSNALKFTSEGSVTLACRNHDDRVVFVVRDTGCGLPDDDESIFDLFTKGSRFVQGMGVGLPLCRKMLRLLDSELHCVSEKNKGTTFSFELKK